MRSSLHLAALAAVFATLSCGGSETGPKTSSLLIGSDSTLLVDEGESLTAREGNGSQLSAQSLSWSSSVPSVASVDANGGVTALSVGQTTITAASSLASGHMTVRVAPQFVQISTGITHTCGITGRAQVYCWGTPLEGEFGSESSLQPCAGVGGSPCAATPVLATRMSFSSIIAGAYLTCGLDSSGGAYCWGTNFFGQLGIGSRISNPTPQPVSGGYQFAQLVAGSDHVCGITIAQDAYCGGNDNTGQLGAGDVSVEQCDNFSPGPCSTTPRLVAGAHKWTRLAASSRTTCGLATSGVAYCWGFDSGGTDTLSCDAPLQYGGCSHTPIQVGGNRLFRDVGIGSGDRCEQATDETLECWGANFTGSFGNGTTDSSSTPVTAAGGAAYASFVASDYGLCALESNGRARCWGAESYGEAGNGITEDRQLTPADVSGGYTFDALISSGNSDYTCGITHAGRAMCWGYGYWGQLGYGGFLNENTPQLVQLVTH